MTRKQTSYYHIFILCRRNDGTLIGLLKKTAVFRHIKGQGINQIHNYQSTTYLFTQFNTLKTNQRGKTGERGEFKIAAVSKYIIEELRDLHIWDKTPWLWSGFTVLIWIALVIFHCKVVLKLWLKIILAYLWPKEKNEHYYCCGYKSKPTVSHSKELC